MSYENALMIMSEVDMLEEDPSLPDVEFDYFIAEEPSCLLDEESEYFILEESSCLLADGEYVVDNEWWYW